MNGRRFTTHAAHLTRSANTQAVVTTSWDDGHVYDFALANLLDEYEIPGTFYVAPRNCELPVRERLRPSDIAALGTRFEIGGHTLSHVRLPTIPDSVALREIEGGKTCLEDILGKSVTSFCYPGGAYEQRHVGMVAEAGFSVARTVERHRADSPRSPLELGTTFHAYRHWSDARQAWTFASGEPRRAARNFLHWDEWAIDHFERVLALGGVFHLWGHSWEIAQRGDWSRLERVLAHIARRDGVRYVTNGELATTRAVPGEVSE